MLRPSCIFCARKHLAQAYVLCEEARQGYPEHIWFAVGHLAEASAELLDKRQDAADKIRDARKILEASINVSADPLKWAIPNFNELLGLLAAPAAPRPIPQNAPAPVPPSAPTTTSADRSLMGAPIPVPAAPECPSCIDKAKQGLWAAEADQMGIGRTYPKGRLLILTTLANFSPGYSLVTVILAQAVAAASAGYRVTLGVHVGCDRRQLPPLPPAIDVVGIIPSFPWGEDRVDDKAVEMIQALIVKALTALGACKIISHDLLFQSWFVTIAKAIHGLPADPRWSWWHMAHSSVAPASPSPATADPSWWRRRLPEGHRLLILNYADIPHFARYYELPSGKVSVLLNSRDIRTHMKMVAATLVSKHTPHLVDVAQLYPLSLPRIQNKHAEKVIELFGTFKKLGQSVRLILATAHANGDKDKIAWVKAACAANGLTDEEVVLTCESMPETAAEGLDSNAIHDLFQVCNLFAFPTESEAGSLVLMEAALSGCLLVLNESLPCLGDYVRREDALWVPWGSIKEKGTSVALEPLAERILDKLSDMSMASKRMALKKHSLERYSEDLAEVLDGSPG